jgi:hypothetical protein
MSLPLKLGIFHELSQDRICTENSLQRTALLPSCTENSRHAWKTPFSGLHFYSVLRKTDHFRNFVKTFAKTKIFVSTLVETLFTVMEEVLARGRGKASDFSVSIEKIRVDSELC